MRPADLGSSWREWLELLKRWWCRRVGHRWRGDSHTEAMITLFVVCRRCGKVDRLRLDDTLEIFKPRNQP